MNKLDNAAIDAAILLLVKNGYRVEKVPATINPETQLSLKGLELSVRTRNCLLAAGVDDIATLLKSTREEILSIPNLNGSGVAEVIDGLGKHGLKLQPDPVYRHDKYMMSPITDLGLPTAMTNILLEAGINRIGDLVQKTKNDLLRIPDMSRHSVIILLDKLTANHLVLGTVFPIK